MKNKVSILWLTFLLLAQYTSAQRSYTLVYTDSLPRIDGELEAGYWAALPVMDSFVTALPYFGRTPQGHTAVQITYTAKGLVIGAVCSGRQVRADGSFRDEVGTGDWFSIGLDTWNDDQNSFVFTVNAFGQRIDSRNTSLGQNANYDAAWKVKTAVKADGWTLEMFIPFTALRFPKGQQQDWGLQCWRYDRTTGEMSTWNPQDPLVKDAVLQYGNLTGWRKIRQRQRLALTAYGQSRYETLASQTSPSGVYKDAFWSKIGGMDGRAGLGSSSTLDFSILPDVTQLGDDPEEPTTLFSMQGQRQLYVEEQAIFTKGLPFQMRMPVSTLELLPYLPPPDGLFFGVRPKREMQPMSEVRFTGRYKNGIGVFASNTVYTKPTFNVVTFELVEKKYPRNPVHSMFGVEKLFRNNSWVQLSCNLFHLGHKEVNTQKGALAWQFRDKRNQFEVKGRFRGQQQAGFSVGEGGGALGKVNGKWTYGIEGQTTYKVRSGLLSSSSPLGANLLYSVNGHVTRRNFNPKHPFWLQTAYFLEGKQSKYTNALFPAKPVMLLGGSGLTRKFQTLAGGLSFRPLETQTWIDFGDTRLYQDILVPMGPYARFKTDERKPIWAEAQANANFVLKQSTMYDAGFSGSVNYRINRTFIFGAAATYLFDNFQSTPSPLLPNERVVEIYKTETYSLKGTFQYSPKRWLVCNAGLGLLRTSDLARAMYTVNVNGIESYPYSFEYDTKSNNHLWFNMRTDLLLNANSMFRLTLDTNVREGINGVPVFTPFLSTQEGFTSFKDLIWNFAFIYNLNRV